MSTVTKKTRTLATAEDLSNHFSVAGVEGLRGKVKLRLKPEGENARGRTDVTLSAEEAGELRVFDLQHVLYDGKQLTALEEEEDGVFYKLG